MRRAVDQVALVDIIGTHAAHEELVHERLHRLEIVVHAREQDALVAERNAVIRQPLERFFHFDGQLARMIHMHTHPERMIFLQHLRKARA